MALLEVTPLEKVLNQARRSCAMIQPELVCRLDGETVIVEGSFHVPSTDPLRAAQGPLASYSIRLELLEGFPAVEPKLFETGQAYPHDPDHHTNHDGTCCFGIWELLLLEYPRMTITDLLDGPVRSYFYGQYHLEQEDSWPFGELAHGVDGIIEAYSKLLACPKDPKIIKSLLVLLKNKRKRGRYLCPCGSGNRMRDCCKRHLDNMPNKIHYRAAQPMFDRFKA